MKTKRTARVQRTGRTLSPRMKVWLEIDGEYVFGHGLNEILLAVQQAGSIKEAANLLRKSYRYIWGRIKEAEASLGRQLVTTIVGGAGSQRSALTPLAVRLSTDFVRLRERVAAMVEREFAERFDVALDD